MTESIKWASTFAGTTRTVMLVVTKDNCTSTYTKDILIKQPAYLNTQDNYPVCQGGTVKIGPNPNDPAAVNPGATFQWTPNLFLNSNSVAQPLSTPPFDIVYTLTSTVNGCAVSKQITVDVNVNLNPVADAGADKTVCIGNAVQIGGSPTATPPTVPAGATIAGVVWSPLSGTAQTQTNPMVSPTTNTTYRVIVVASTGCTDTDFVNVVVEQKAKIGDYVWSDNSATGAGNGCQDAGELGINGVTVKLFTSAGVEVASTTTGNNPVGGAAGYYQFEVCAGSYYVNFGQPVGYVFTGDKVCGNVNSDSDANITTSNSQTVTLTPGQVVSNIDAGYKPLGNIRGNVTADTNNDNIGDTPLQNVTLQLKDAVTGAVVATTTTDASGNYAFLNVLTGNYVIMETDPAGYQDVSDVDATPDPDGNDGATPNDMIPVTVSVGENDNDNNFVEEQLANIRGNVKADTNNDNTGDVALGNITIQLKDAITGTVVATTTTDASGNYQFLNVAPGNYNVVETQPANYLSVSDVDATPDPDGNDGTTPNDIIPVTLAAGENDNDNNFVEEQPGSISGTVTADTNNDNIGDTPLANVTLQLKDAVTGAVIATTTTNAQGQYSFTNVAPGNYTIMETDPAGYQDVSDVDTTPDPDGNDGATPNDMIPVTVTAGEADNNNDFVEEQLANIRGNVKADTNNDDTGDLAIGNVTIELKDAVTGAVVATTTTDASGNYQFLNVAPGNYNVVETQPAGYTSVSDVDATPDPDGNDGTTPNNAITVVLTAGENDNDNNFVEEQPASISGTVTADTNNDNIGDTPLANVTLQLKDAVTGAVIATTTTNAQGQYTFSNVAPGNYTIMETDPAGYQDVSDVDTTPDPDGNDGATPNDMIPVTVTAGEADNNNDFVEEQLANIRGNVKADTNNDNTGDVAIGNVTIELKDAVTGAVVATTTTDASGNYQFLNVAPGNYNVVETQPAGYTNVSDVDATPDPDGNDGTTPNNAIPVVLTAGENDNDNNFVEEQPGSLGN
ncbi:MAG: carboxypeptidase regulatory-like domain-containing protein [Saprospiraceae bacterium]|nr:carboxypeptidase regulatory-like domain-containing protein [Saprospiraceae bacterium]